jgi:hypothetical protein
MWDGSCGAYRVLTKDQGGWEDIQRAFLYQVWDARIVFAQYDKHIAKCVGLPEFPWLHAIVARQDAWADWFGERIVGSFRSRTRAVEGWEEGRLGAFCLKLYAKWRTVDLGGRNLPLIEVYQRVFDSWNDQDGLALALRGACDFHVENSVDDDPDGVWDFLRPLYRLFPVEILAIKRVRLEQGLPMPDIDHALMQTPLAHPPDPMPEVHDELLEAVIAKARKDLPIGDPW